MALEQASANEAPAPDVGEIKWNAASPSRPKVEYDDRVAEIQLKLKKINLYAGKIDGLKGHETTEAIKSWEQFNSDSVDGEISDSEMAVLDENAATSSKDDKQLSNNTKSVKQNERKKTSNTVKVPGAGSITFIDSTRDDKNELELLFYNGAAYKEQYDICRDFQDKYVTFHYRIDKNLEKNYTKYQDASNKAATDIAECKGLYYCPRKERNWVKTPPSQRVDKWKRGKGCSMVRSLNITQADNFILEVADHYHISSKQVQAMAREAFHKKHGLKDKDVFLEEERRKKKILEKELEGLIKMIADVETAKLLGTDNKKISKSVLNNLRLLMNETQQKIEQIDFKIKEFSSRQKVLDWFDEFKLEGRLRRNASDEEKKSYINGLIERIDVFYDAKHNLHTLNIKFIMPLVNRLNPDGTIGIKEIKHIFKKNRRWA